MSTKQQFKIRGRQERGRTQLNWLDSYHSFSFGDYYDPRYMGYSDLRVINDDIIAAGGGFGMHPHRDMEIVTVVLDGELEHKDSMGNGSIIQAGDVQRMSAGTGILHSEFNPSSQNPARLLQIWILPAQKSLTPSYEQKSFPITERQGRFQLLASSDGRDGSITIHQDAELYSTVLNTGEQTQFQLSDPARQLWIQIATGTVEINEQLLEEGDTTTVKSDQILTIKSLEDQSQVLVFNLR
jgi:quercetin 2,3-dioxygenase